MSVEYLDTALLTCVLSDQLASQSGKPMQTRGIMVGAVTISDWGGNMMAGDIERVDFTITQPDATGAIACRTYFFLRDSDADTLTLPTFTPDDFVSDTRRATGDERLYQVYEIGYQDAVPVITSTNLHAVRLFQIIPGIPPEADTTDEGVSG